MNVKEVAITVAVSILFTVFVLVFIDAVYPHPEYDDFCTTEFGRAVVPKIQECSYQQTQEEVDCYNSKGTPHFTYDDNGCSVFDYCDSCSLDFDNARSAYANNIFLILAPIGIIAIFFGVYYKIDFIASGFMFAGIMLLFYGTVQNFSELGKWMRVLVIFLELCLVLFIAYKKVASPIKKK